LKSNNEDENYTAVLREAGESIIRAVGTSTKNSFSDEQILERAISAVDNIFTNRFINQKKKDAGLTVEQSVKEQLSKISSVPSFIPRLQ
jgi:hypothetical protein